MILIHISIIQAYTYKGSRYIKERRNEMANDDKIEMEGTVTNVLKGTQYIVTLNDNGHEVHATLSGKLRINKIKVLKGDAVVVAISPYDLNRGIITWRNK